MAKYNAIYEGRLPHGLYAKIVSDRKNTHYHGLADFLTILRNKLLKKIINFFS